MCATPTNSPTPRTNATSPKGGAWNATKATPTAWSSPSSTTTPSTTGTTTYQLQYDEEDVTGITKRMLSQVQQTNEVADHTLREIDAQNEKLKHEQDEAAEIHDSLNASQRELRGLGSIWGNISNAFRKNKKQEHKKGRQKYEKEYAKDKLKTAEANAAAEDVDTAEKVEEHKKVIKASVEAQASALSQAKDQSRAQIKSGGGSGGPTMASGKFVFEERTDTTQRCEAERDLDEIGEHISQLKQKAGVMGGALEEGNDRLENLNDEMERANDRTKTVNKKAASFLQ